LFSFLILKGVWDIEHDIKMTSKKIISRDYLFGAFFVGFGSQMNFVLHVFKTNSNFKFALNINHTNEKNIGVWQGVAMDSLKFHPGLPCPTLLCPVGGPSLKRLYGRFRGGPLAERAACGHRLTLWIP
jgi:hypothetical protein